LTWYQQFGGGCLGASTLFQQAADQLNVSDAVAIVDKVFADLANDDLGGYGDL
jgi:hypothetical protein